MMDCVNLLNANLLKFEKYSLNLETVVQYSEPSNFWNLFSSKSNKNNLKNENIELDL